MNRQLALPAVFTNAVVFAGVVAMAVYLHWTARDLLWGLWISSLSIGYLTIVTGILGGILRGRLFEMKTEEQTADGNNKNPPPAVLAVFFVLPVAFFFGFSRVTLVFVLLAAVSVVATVIKHIAGMDDSGRKNGLSGFMINLLINFPAGLFMLAFFTIHFGGFHFIHSLFLNGFFPLIDEQPFGQTPSQTFGMFTDFITVCLHNYWFFILASAISSFDHIMDALKGDRGNFMFEPYRNVIKMHLMIFVIAFASMAGLHQYVLYATLFLYFFPAVELIKGVRSLMTGAPVVETNTEAGSE